MQPDPNQAICICSTTKAIPSFLKEHTDAFSNVTSFGHRWIIQDLLGGINDPRLSPELEDLIRKWKWFSFTEHDIRTILKFDGQPSKKHFWNSYGNRNIVWFYAAFRMMNFYLAYPNYDYYWFLDDDVKCNDWNTFFNGFKDDKTDFLAYYLFKNIGVTKNQHISEVSAPMHSFHGDGYNWFSRFPGDGDNLPPILAPDMYGSFFAITRFSNKSMQALMMNHRFGFWGYSEGFVPTVLGNIGDGEDFSLGSIYKKDDTSDFFDVEKVKVLHKNEKITWSWL